MDLLARRSGQHSFEVRLPLPGAEQDRRHWPARITVRRQAPDHGDGQS